MNRGNVDVIHRLSVITLYAMVIISKLCADEVDVKPILQISETQIWEFSNVALTCTCPEATPPLPPLVTWTLVRPNHNLSSFIVQMFNKTDKICKTEYEFVNITYIPKCKNATTFELTNISLSRQENGYNWTCKCGLNLVESTTITTIINVPVKSVNLRFGDTNISKVTTIHVVNNYITTLKCSSTCARPEAIISWYRQENISTNISSSKSTNTGLICSHSVLSFIPTLENQREEIYCSASNKEGEQLLSPKVTVDVLYPPLVGQSPNVSAIEGKDFKISCNEVPGNPNKTNYYWSNKNNLIISKERDLTIPKVSRKNDTFFTCRATNEMKPTIGSVVNGTSKKSFHLTVYFPTEIRTFSLSTKKSGETVVVNKSDNVSLACFAEANPSSNLSISNPRGDYITEVSNSNTARHTLVKVSYTNAGEYECTGRNNYTKGSNASSHLILIVRCPPRPSTGNRSIVKVATVMYVDVTLSFLAWKYLDEPNKTVFRWFKENENIFENGFKFTIRTEELQTNLSIRNITEQDLGLYRIFVQNSVGEYVHYYLLNTEATSHRPTENICSSNTGILLGVGAGTFFFTFLIVACLPIGYKRLKKLKSSRLKSCDQVDMNEHKLSVTEDSQVSSVYTDLDKNKKEVNVYDAVNAQSMSSQQQNMLTKRPSAYIEMKDNRDLTKDTLEYINIKI